MQSIDGSHSVLKLRNSVSTGRLDPGRTAILAAATLVISHPNACAARSASGLRECPASSPAFDLLYIVSATVIYDLME
ncbi:hypothetical protein FHX57_003861 [Paraburkholderia tropica]|nr:hypothetical protein [Paraburkholderia tropica]MBB3001504.1 hypothetical protein [Paraburkholderia tropica]MBB6322821.1 hypothetical protein [Paraburkholderia tropica]QNB16917.1 hypothetical protein G5S35_35785 [Paraburkholderia tropica]